MDVKKMFIEEKPKPVKTIFMSPKDIIENHMPDLENTIKEDD